MASRETCHYAAAMRLTILGSGTAIPVPDRFPAGYWLRSGKTSVLVDCGPGTLRRFAQAGGDLAALDAVCLTHYHTDHCADLAALLFALRSPHFAGRKPLRLHGAPGLRRLLQLLTEAWPWLAPRGYELEIEEVLPGDFGVGDLAVEAIAIRHTAQSLGYRFTDQYGSAAFSGDADECEELVELARNVDWFVCDAATPDDDKLDGHLTPGLAGRYAERAGARQLLLTHFYPSCQGRDVVAMARANFRGTVHAVTDLQQFVLEGQG
jgi:ribonuclease BN (tRNA processing enzyme)